MEIDQSIKSKEFRLADWGLVLDVARYRFRITWWHLILFLNTFFTLTTVFLAYMPREVKNGPLHHFNLSSEMNLSVWWSSILLFLLAVQAYTYFSERRADLRGPWLVLAFTLSLLSMDEIGSLHELAGGFDLLMLPMLGFFLLLAYAHLVLFFHHRTRKASLLIGIGFLVMSSAILQEYIEHIVLWPRWAWGLRVGLEEGSELFGMAIILWGLVTIPEGTDKNKRVRFILPDLHKWRFLIPILLAGVILQIGISLLMKWNRLPTDKGNPAVWFPEAVYFLLFLGAFGSLVNAEGHSRLRYFLWGIFFLANSILAVYVVGPRNMSSRIERIDGFFYIFYTLQLMIAMLLFLWSLSGEHRKEMLLLVVNALLIFISWSIGGITNQYIVAGLFAGLIALLFLRMAYIPNNTPQAVKAST